MSSESLVRTRVLRGPVVAGLRGVALDADLSLLRPLTAMTSAASADAAAAADAVRAEASRVGYEDGFTAGQAAGVAEGQALTAAALSRLETALQAVESAAAELGIRQAGAVADVERSVATLAVQIAEAILGRELAAMDAPGYDAVARALQLAPKGVDVLARMNPLDAEAIGDLGSLTAERAVTIIPDGAVERGGCIVEAGACRIDAQITPALQRVREALGLSPQAAPAVGHLNA